MPDAVANGTPGNNGDFVKKHKNALIFGGIALAGIVVFILIRRKTSTGVTATTTGAVPLISTGGGNLSFPSPVQVFPTNPTAGTPSTEPPPRKPPHKKPPKKHHKAKDATTHASTHGGAVPLSGLTHAHITHTGGGSHTTRNFHH